MLIKCNVEIISCVRVMKVQLDLAFNSTHLFVELSKFLFRKISLSPMNKIMNSELEIYRKILT